MTTLNEAIESLRRTGDTRQILDHWQQTRIALLHDVIRDFLDDMPAAGVSPVLVARLEDAAASLREQIAEMVTR